MKSSSSSNTATTNTPVVLYMPSLGSFKICSLILGLLVGFFIYLSTLGAEFVAVMLWGRDILQKTNNELILFSLGWNLITTFLALLVLSTLRRIVVVVAQATLHHAAAAEDIIAELLSYLEGRFAVGALIGICLSWNVTNMILGMRPQIIQSCIILAIACLWCRLTLILLGQPDTGLIHDTLPEQDEEAAQRPPATSPNDDSDDKTRPLLQIL